MVKPILLYSADIWGVEELLKDNIDLVTYHPNYEKACVSYCKQIVRVPKQASNTAVRLKLGNEPILFDIIIINGSKI